MSALRIEEDELLGKLMWRDRSGRGFEEGSMKIPSKGIFRERRGEVEGYVVVLEKEIE